MEHEIGHREIPVSAEQKFVSSAANFAREQVGHGITFSALPGEDELSAETRIKKATSVTRTFSRGFAASCSPVELLQLGGQSPAETASLIKRALPSEADTQEEQIFMVKALRFATSPQMITYRAMEEYVKTEGKDHAFRDEDLKNKKGKLLTGASLLARKASILRREQTHLSPEQEQQAQEKAAVYQFQEKELLDKSGRPLKGAALEARKKTIIKNQFFEKKPTRFVDLLSANLRQQEQRVDQEIRQLVVATPGMTGEKVPVVEAALDKFMRARHKVAYTIARALFPLVTILSLLGPVRQFTAPFNLSPARAAGEAKQEIVLSPEEMQRYELGGVRITSQSEVQETMAEKPTVIAAAELASATPEPTKEAPTSLPSPTVTVERPSPTATVSPTVTPEKAAENQPFALLERMQAKVGKNREERSRKDPEYAKRINKELNQNRVNFLLLGKDTSGVVGRYDAIVVVSIDTKTGKTLISRIPRDLHSPEVDDLEKAKAYKGMAFRINAMGTFGNLPDARRIVENATGLSQDACISVDFEAFERMIDTVGGIDIELSERFVQMYQQEVKDICGTTVQKGKNHFDGKTALTYCRVRKSDSDYQRGDRQVEIMRLTAATLGQRLREKPTLTADIINQLRKLQEEGKLNLSSEFSFLDITEMVFAAGKTDMRELMNTDKIDMFSPWGELVESGRLEGDKYQLYLKGAPTADPANPTDYWKPMREKYERQLRTNTKVGRAFDRSQQKVAFARSSSRV